MKFAFLFFVLIVGIMETTAQDLKAQLEVSYNAFREAVLSKDAGKFKDALSSYAYMNLKNKMATTGANFPDAFFSMGAMMLKDLKTLKFQKIISTNVAARAFYADPNDDYLLISFNFLKEGGQWKSNMLQMTGSPEISKALKAGDLSFLSGKEYQPEDVLPAVPVEAVKSDFQGVLDVFGYGYLVTINVNGVEQRATDNSSSSGWILGGLKKGKNKIVISSKPIEGEKPATITVKIRTLQDGKENEVLSYEKNGPPPREELEFELK